MGTGGVCDEEFRIAYSTPPSDFEWIMTVLAIVSLKEGSYVVMARGLVAFPVLSLTDHTAVGSAAVAAGAGFLDLPWSGCAA